MNVKLADIWDGDSGPVVGFDVLDENGQALDTSTVALEVDVTLDDGTLIATLPGIPRVPRSSGEMFVYLKGRETDYGGAGATLFLNPRVWMAKAPDGSRAANLLLNPSLDLDSNGDGVPDSWTRGGSVLNSVYGVGSDDPGPPVIYGNRQSVYHPATGNTDFLSQSPAIAIAAGDTISAGIWHRATLDAGATILPRGGYYIRLNAFGGLGNTTTPLPVGDRDWSFQTISARALSSASAVTFILAAFDAIGYRACFDDAFLFKGTWAISMPDYFVVTVKPRLRSRPRPLANTALSDGIGGFENDSDGDGFPDGWSNHAQGNTFSLDTTQVSQSGSMSSLKIGLNATTGRFIRFLARGHFKAGETWVVTASYKTNGALTGTPAANTFGLAVSTEPFNGPVESAYSANFLTNQAVWNTTQASLTLGQDHDVLQVDVNLNGVTGTMWLDELALYHL